MKREDRNGTGRLRSCALGALVLSAGVTAGTIGCGGGSEGKFSSSLDGNQTLGSLSDADRARLCHSQMDRLYSLFDDSNYCRYEAKIIAYYGTPAPTDDATFLASCAKAYNDCNRAPADSLSEARDSAHRDCDKEWSWRSGCEMTVATFDECIDESSDRTKSIISSACEGVSLEDFRQLVTSETFTEKCVVPFNEPCPSDP